MQKNMSRQSKAKSKLHFAQPVEIIPGIKLTDTTWLNLIHREENEEFIADIVEEISQNAMSKIYEIYLERQSIPYTVHTVGDMLMNLIKWQFLPCDKGESQLQKNPTWMENEEPERSVVDSWAEGILVYIENTEDTSEEIVPEHISQDNLKDSSKEALKSLSPKKDIPISIHDIKKSGKPKPVIQPVTSVRNSIKETDDTKKPLISYLTSSTISPTVKMNTPTTKKPDQIQKITQIEESEPSQKLHPDTLGSQRIKTGYTLISPGGKAVKGTKVLKVTSKNIQSTSAGTKDIREVSFTKCPPPKACPTDKPFPYPFTDMVTLCPGVIIKEGQYVKKPQMQNITSGKIPSPCGPFVTLVPEKLEAEVLISSIVGSEEPRVRKLAVKPPEIKNDDDFIKQEN